MKIAIGADPNAEDFKKQLIPYMRELGHDVLDYGSDDPIYANVAVSVCSDVVAGKADRGVLICGTGIGMSIAANKVEGAYAALVTDVYQAQRAQLSNNANIMTMGAQVTGIELAKCLVKEYLANTYERNSRSASKVDRIVEYEKKGA
ncbi:MAG: RpiB/LacA/LacB family sugar-phosphate isomerase [Synergistaceae bacterium]|jgi:ribose 5-phosphate isomerase B|nr:RpiB/LacA/LacB family sugar-phosphate isomerase [Synergistaceae bacterium]